MESTRKSSKNEEEQLLINHNQTDNLDANLSDDNQVLNKNEIEGNSDEDKDLNELIQIANNRVH